jgi:two-component system chemotaxis response regulator CheB
MVKRVRVLLVDDSPMFIEALCRALEQDRQMEIVGIAEDGKKAIDLAVRLRPDVITMDVQMPVLGGIEAIQKIMNKAPAPILVLTHGTTREKNDALTLEALRAGAVDLWPKPLSLPPDPQEAEALTKHIRLLAGVAVVARPDPTRKREKTSPGMRIDGGVRFVGIVASTGGPQELAAILGQIPPTFAAPVLVVQHLPPGFASSLASWLEGITRLQVRVARSGDKPERGMLLLAPDGAHMRLRSTGRIELDPAPEIDGARPSGTALFESLAELDGPRTVGVVLSGMGADGARGLAAIRRRGGMVFVQDPTTAVIGGMPRSALEAVPDANVVSVERLTRNLLRLAGGGGGQ